MSRLGLDNVEWKEFGFCEIFKKIQRGKRLTKGNQFEGDTPYVSSTAMNNGVDNFVSNKDNVRIFNDCLTVANSGSVGACFYHCYEFVASDHVTSLKSNKANKYTYLFMSTIVKRLEEKYSFNREINDNRIKKEKIILPVDSNGNPNWKFMEEYIKQELRIQAQKVANYYEQRMIECGFGLLDLKNVERKESYLTELFEKNRSKQNKIGAYKNVDIPLVSANNVGNGNKVLGSDNLVIEYIYKLAVYLGQSEYSLGCKNIQWKEFWLENIVDIRSGVRLTKADQKPGKRPFIGSTDGNNGVTNFVSNINNSLDSNLLGVNYNGSVVDNFYHPYECIFSDDVKRLHFKDKSARNKYCYLFLKQCILKQKSKYAYGYKFNAARMKRQKIMLPVNSTGKVDYDFMRKYMVVQEIKELYKVIKYLV